MLHECFLQHIYSAIQSFGTDSFLNNGTREIYQPTH